MASHDELLLVRQLPMDMDYDGQGRRLAHLLPPLARSPGPPPFRPPPPPAAAASAESRVSFRGWLGAPRHWDLWVAKLHPIHHRLWLKLGILDAVLASTYRFKRDASAVLHVASFWSPNTNTFAFPWGEATLTLHDVAVLGGFPAHGSPAPAPLPPQWRPDEAALNGVRLGFNRSACKKAHHSAWVKHFLTDTATDEVIEHAAFLALWLTRFVLPGHPESTMRQSVFPLAVRLAHGERVALGPAVLASLYRDLRELKAYLVAASAAATGGNAELLSPLSVYAPLYILQLWVWERFPALWAGKVNPIKDGEPRAARWHDVSKKMNPTVLREVLSKGKNFVWQPYTSSVQAWKQHSGWVRGSDVTGNDELRSLAHCLHACELVGMDCIEQYLPHRVAMQFGLDQDVPGDVHRANEDWAVAWETYDLEGKNVAFFIPQSEPGVTARYAQWWRQPLSPSNLDVGAASIAVECKVSKRKVKKTPAAMEAEAEKERKMKKVRISPNDKKRKLEELYDSKLSDWLAAARNGSSGTGGGSCKRGSSPKSDTRSDKALLADVETIKDAIVLLVPRKQTTPSSVKPKKDKNMNPAIGDKGSFIDNSLAGMKEKSVKLKGNWTGDVHHPVNQSLWKEKRGAVSTEISTSTEDYNAEWSGMISKNANELVRGETPDVSNRSEEAKPPVPMEKEESSDHLSDGCCKEAAIEDVVTVDKLPDISNPERGVTATLEEKRLNFPVDKSLDVTDRPEEGATATLELEKDSNLAVDESCGVSNRPEEVAAPVMEEREEKVATAEVLAVMEMDATEKNIVIVREANEDNTVSEEDERAADGDTDSIEVAPQSKEEIDSGFINNCHDATTLPQEVLPIQQANHFGLCIEMSHIMEDGNVVAGVLGTNDGETTCCDIVAKDQREVPCVEEIGGGESNQMVEKESKEKPLEAPQAEIVEFRELIIPMEKDNENEHKKVPLTVEEGENAEVDKAMNLAKKDAGEIPMEVTEVEEAEQEQVSALTQGGSGEEHKEVPQIEHIDMVEPKVRAQFDTEKHREVAEVERAEMDDTDKLTGRDTDGKPGDVSEIGNAEMEKARVLIEKDTDEKLADVSEVEDVEVEELKGLMKEGTDKKFEEVAELGNIGMGEIHGTMEEDADGKLNEAPDLTAEVEDRPEGILQVDLSESGDARWLAKEGTKDNTTEVPQVNHEKLRDEPPIEGHISEKPSAYGEDLPEQDVNVSKEVYQVEQVEGEDCKVSREKDTEEETKDTFGVEQEEGQVKALTGKDIHGYVEKNTVVEQVDPKELTQAQGKEIDKDMMEASNNSISGEISCNSASIQSKGKQKEASDEGIAEKQCIQDVELINERESSSDAVAMKVEGVDDHKTLDMHGEVATKMIQDRGIIHEYKETRILEDRHKLGSGLKSDLVILEIDETQDTEGIQNQENLDLDKQQTMEERQDLGTTVENKKMEILEDANILGCGEFQTDSPGMEVNEVESTKGTQNQEHSDIKEEQVMEKRLVCGITDGNERPLEEANTLGSSGVDTISVAVDVSEANSVNGMQNQEACSTEESQAREEKQHHGVGNVNEKRILEDTSTIDSGELKSDAAIVWVDGAESREGTRNQWALSMEKEPAVQGKLDQGMADENIKRILVDTDAIECGGVKPDGTMKMAHDTLPTGQVADIAGDRISSKGVPWEEHNKSDIEGSESNRTARKEFEGALRPQFQNQVEVKQEKLDNKMEMSIGRGNDEASEQDQTSTDDAIIAPSGTDDHGENNKEWAEESIESYGKYSSDPVNTACQPSKFCRPSFEEVRRIHSGRSIYLKDIKESQGRIRSEPSNRVHINNVGYYSRHAVQEPVSVSKDIKVPLHDTSRVCGRDRAPELVVTGPPEETSRWRQEQYALQILEEVQNSRIAEKTRMEMEIRVLKAQIASMQRQVMNMDHVGEVISRSKRH